MYARKFAAEKESCLVLKSNRGLIVDWFCQSILPNKKNNPAWVTAKASARGLVDLNIAANGEFVK